LDAPGNIQYARCRVNQQHRVGRQAVARHGSGEDVQQIYGMTGTNRR
jgi:hypothetical protein